MKRTSLLYKDSSVSMNLHMEKPASSWMTWRTWGERYMWLALHGPGRVAIQSAYGHFHDPGHNIVADSGITHHRW